MEPKASLKECKTDSRHTTDVQCPAGICLSCISFWKRNFSAAGQTGSLRIAWFGKELVLVEMQIPGYEKTIANLSQVAEIKKCQVLAANQMLQINVILISATGI